MKIKVCGMRDPQNIEDLARLNIDLMGFIFYPKSSRYVDNIKADILNNIPKHIGRVGVFVNETVETIETAALQYNLTHIQLHGQESPEICLTLKNKGFTIIKAFNVETKEDFDLTFVYQTSCHYFLFDTKTSKHGGSGVKFDWNILNDYKGTTPFFLSGGISENDVLEIKKLNHRQLFALDLNSKFEISPALKDIEKLNMFIQNIKNK